MKDNKDLIFPDYEDAKKAWDEARDESWPARDILDLYFSNPGYKTDAIKKISLDLLSHLNALYRVRTKYSWVRSHMLDLQKNNCDIEIENFDQAVDQLSEAINSIDNYREYLESHIKGARRSEE